jgi:hypothetical protein
MLIPAAVVAAPRFGSGHAAPPHHSGVCIQGRPGEMSGLPGYFTGSRDDGEARREQICASRAEPIAEPIGE